MNGTNNAIVRNSIHSNTFLGIDLGSGANNDQNFPVLTSAVTNGTQITVEGTLNSIANTSFRIEIYSNVTGDPTGYGEGQTLIGILDVGTDSFGNASFSSVLSASVSAGSAISATVSQLDMGDAEIETSEFAQNVIATATGNTAPDLSGAGFHLTSISEDTIINNGDLVLAIIASAGGDPITDADAGALEGIAIFSLSDSNGTWEYDIGSGWNPVGSVSVATSLLLRDTDSLRFVPNTNWNGTELFSFAAWDQTSGTAGTKVDTSVYGGASAFSSGTAIPSITVEGVNDAPTNIVPGTQTVDEETPTSISGISITDVDAASADLTTRVAVANGLLNVILAGGATISSGANGTGDLTVLGTIADINTTLSSLTYTGNTGVSGIAADSLAVITNDGGNTGTGGAQQVLNFVQIDINPVNQAPNDLQVTTTAYGGLSINEDGGNDAYLVADGSPFNGQTATTIEVQFSADSAATGMTTLFSYADATNQDELFFGIDPTGELFYRTSANGSAGYGSITSAPQLFDGQQHTVAVTWENSGGILMFYVDGEQLGLGRNDYQKTTTIDAGGTVVIGQHQGAARSVLRRQRYILGDDIQCSRL